MRLGTAAGAPPGTAMRTGSRAGQVAGTGMSLQTAVEVNARPAVMREGMKGVALTTAGGAPSTSYGPGRQVVDRSYYVGLIRPKVSELTQEIDRLRMQEASIAKNSSVIIQLQSKQKSLTEEIGALKQQLTDVNYAVEQSTSGELEQINAHAQQLRQANAEARRLVDKIFLQNKDVAASIKREQEQLDSELKALDERLKKQDPSVYAQYRALRDEAYRVADSVLTLQQEIKQQEAKHEQLKTILARDPEKKRASQLVVDILKKRQMRDDMAKECSLSVEQEREMLLKAAKQMGADTDVLKRQIVEAKDALQDAKTRLSSLEEDLSEYSGDNVRKFQELKERDREMTEFMDQFKVKEAEELAKIREVENNITSLLEQVSRKLTLKKAMPAENAAVQLEAMTAEHGTKEEQLEAARKTHERLQKQLVERKEELEKVQFLDEKIQSELAMISGKVSEQQEEILKFSDLDKLRRDVEARKSHLTATRAHLIVQRDAAKLHMNNMTKRFETAKQVLHDDQVFASLSANEQKLRMIWQSAFALEDFVRYKEKETQYTGLKADCLRMVDECNAMIKDAKRAEATVSLAKP